MDEKSKIVIQANFQDTDQAAEEKSLIENSQLDPQAFKPLYEKYFKRIFLFILHRVGEKSIAGDLASQVFLKAMMNIHRFTFRGIPFSAWLFRIALNECNDYFRKSKRHRIVTMEEQMVAHLHEELTADTKLDDLKEQLPVILQQLSADDLHIIELRFFERRPFREVADIIGITETYAKVKVYRILEKMKKLFLKRS
ncbi:MAG TPA: sigma-70 family RNA polymerase sigma factor [Chryseolinea sp.]|nr:sigma-70 family RNA polymerase sigma factor [Chryseolinea sp.]